MRDYLEKFADSGYKFMNMEGLLAGYSAPMAAFFYAKEETGRHQYLNEAAEASIEASFSDPQNALKYVGAGLILLAGSELTLRSMENLKDVNRRFYEGEERAGLKVLEENIAESKKEGLSSTYRDRLDRRKEALEDYLERFLSSRKP